MDKNIIKKPKLQNVYAFCNLVTLLSRKNSVKGKHKAEAKGPKTCETDNDAFNKKLFILKNDAMETVSNVVQGTLPNYLKDLPIPKTVLGWFSLGISDWMRILPFGIWNLAAVGGLSYVTLQALSNAPGIGPAIKVLSVNIEN